MVVFHHTGFTTAFELRACGSRSRTTRWRSATTSARMDSGVQVFFLISGFLLYRPMVAAAFAGKQPRDVRSYSRHRFLRIYPAYWVAFVIITIFFGIHDADRGLPQHLRVLLPRSTSTTAASTIVNGSTRSARSAGSRSRGRSWWR